MTGAAVALTRSSHGPVARLFGLIPLPAPLVTTLLAIVVGYVVATEVAKLVFYRVVTRTAA